MGQLGGQEDAVAQVVLFEDGAHRLFVAAVEVGGVEVVDALLDGIEHERLGRFHVDAPERGGGEAHAAEAED